MASRRTGATVGLAVALGTVAPTCANVEPIATNTCGNTVVESGEDCDTFASQGMACRPPADEKQCRFACTVPADAPPTCAPAFGCGQDSVCRVPRGELEHRLDVTDGAAVLLPGDYDGDGWTDVFAGTMDNPSLTYLGPGFTEEDSVDLFFMSRGAPIVASQLTEDVDVAVTADVAFADIDGIGVVRGSDERLLVGTVYPSFEIPVADAVVLRADAIPSLAGEEALTIVDWDDGRAIVLLVDLATVQGQPSHFVTASGVLPPLAAARGDELEAVPSGRLDGSSPCDQYVVGFPNADEVFVGTPCTGTGAVNGTGFGPLQIVGDTPIPLSKIDFAQCPIEVGRTFILDADGDGLLDVVVAPQKPQLATPCLVPGPFTFAPGPAPTPIPAQPYGLFELIEEEGLLERVLDVVHLDGDGIPDLVTSYGIFMSQTAECPTNLTERKSPQPGVWHCGRVNAGVNKGHYISSAIGDMNANGFADVALAPDLGQTISVFSGYEGKSFASFVVETEAYAGDLAFGDLDGDGLDDLVFADRACAPLECGDPRAGGGESDILAVAFGRVTGGPEDSRDIGRLGRIEQIQVATFSLPFGGIDAPEDLAVVARDTDNSSLSTSVLHGSTLRQLQAPFFLFEEAEGEGNADVLYYPVALAAGRFAEAAEPDGYQPRSSTESQRRDLCAVAFGVDEDEIVDGKLPPPPDRVRIFLLASEGEAELAGSRSWPSVEVGKWADHHVLGGFAAAAELDDPGLAVDRADEVVYVSGRGLSIARVQQIGTGAEAHPLLVPEDVPLDITVRSSLGATSALAAELAGQETFADAPKIPMLLEDVDGDGLRDILLLGTDGGLARLVILYNGDGWGSPKVESTALDGTPNAFLALNFDADPALEIFVAFATGLVVFDLGGLDNRALVSSHRPPGLRSDAPEIISLASADFDHDGVRDLVLGHQDSMSFYRSLPRNE